MNALEQAKELRDIIQRVHPFDFALNERCEKLVETLEAKNVVDTGGDSGTGSAGEGESLGDA
jgi:hypothetical protein